jgi:hypothetical protein
MWLLDKRLFQLIGIRLYKGIKWILIAFVIAFAVVFFSSVFYGLLSLILPVPIAMIGTCFILGCILLGFADRSDERE